ncbi:MAG TPA: aminoglycoside phosphotransferase family protein [Pyrinomonadaceae bacterium]|nr:aminoglycoside phosphotransferase family protein [Pyrinomonadaceae bacterium]
MPTPNSLPTTPRELTSALYAAGSLREGSILSVAITKQIETPISHLWFLEVVYAPGSAPTLPDRLLLKWAIEESPAPERGEPEIVFYRQLAPALPSPPMIRCLATATPASKEQWLILEDLRSSHTNPPWPERPSDKAVYDAVAVLAQLHARWWEAPALGSTVGHWHTETALRTMVHGFRDHLPGFFADLGDDLPLADRGVLETAFNSSLRPWLRLLDRRALTVVHGDAHTWNFLFPRAGDGVPYIFDWQLWHLDVAAKDLAFMIGLHWDRSTRQQLELPLLHFYHEELIRAGIDTYSFDDLMLDYRRCLVRNLTFPIILWSRGNSRESWRRRLDHALAAYRDLNAAELL